MNILQAQDPELYQAVFLEEKRQLENVELIASENFTSEAVRAAVGSVLTHKYAEGYPDKRYYGGCENVDMVEDLAIARAKELFQCEFANVQPHSGSQANMGAYFALCNPGDTVLAMDLSQGGHLTHGSPVNFSGRLFNIVPYGVDRETGLLNYDEILRLAKEHRPQLILAGATVYPRIIDFARFRAIADEVGAYLMADIAHIAGLVATGEHPTSIGHAHITTTTTHKTLRGARGGMILSDEEFGKKVNSQIFPGIQGGPLMHVIAAKAVAFKEALAPEFSTYQKQVCKNARALAEPFLENGYDVMTGGTDNHLLLLDLTAKDITGKDAQIALDRAGITTNKNTVPFDKRSPFVTSGIRLGSPAMTSRGFKEEDMQKTAQWIIAVLENKDNDTILAEIKQKVAHHAREFPLFAW